MNRENLYDAVTEVSDEHLNRADARHEQKKSAARRRWRRAAVAAVLVIAVLGGVVIHSFTGNGGVVGPKAYAVALAEYPEVSADPRKDWGDYADGVERFAVTTMQEFLSDAQGENKVYSPLNVYMALAMLAEITDGESRGQILNLLGETDMTTLRRHANSLWNANYYNGEKVTSILGSSVWLDEAVEYKDGPLKVLAEHYYASTYQGTMGSDAYNKVLQDWLNEQTGGLLAEQAAGQEFDAGTVLALATTIYYKCRWAATFSEADVEERTFHGAKGDVSVPFLYQVDGKNYYWGERFSAVQQRLDYSGGMWFILPDEGVSVDDLLADEETMAFVRSPKRWNNSKFVLVKESIPKFDVVSKTDLKDGLKSLGVTDVFDEANADFSPVTDAEPVWVSAVDHAARVVIDEEGVEAAAYTVIAAETDAMPPDEVVDFVVDRPFLFVLTGIDGLPLFVGIVNNP